MAVIVTIISIGAALQFKCVLETNLIRVSWHCISCYFHSNSLCHEITKQEKQQIKTYSYMHSLSNQKHKPQYILYVYKCYYE